MEPSSQNGACWIPPMDFSPSPQVLWLRLTSLPPTGWAMDLHNVWSCEFTLFHDANMGLGAFAGDNLQVDGFLTPHPLPPSFSQQIHPDRHLFTVFLPAGFWDTRKKSSREKLLCAGRIKHHPPAQWFPLCKLPLPPMHSCNWGWGHIYLRNIFACILLSLCAPISETFLAYSTMWMHCLLST